nr:hypothetical protein [Tanacetum cinerariifolium]
MAMTRAEGTLPRLTTARTEIHGAGYASYPYPKTAGDVTVLGRYKSQILSRGREIDLFSLIRVPNPTKVKTGSRPRAPHELPLLTLTALCVIEMDELAAATDSSGVPSTIERFPLDFAHEAEVFGRETAAPEMPPPEDLPIATAPGTDQAVETVTVEPSAVRESRKRGYEGINANAPPKSLRRVHADLRPSGSSRGGKSLAAMQLCLASNIFMSEGTHTPLTRTPPNRTPSTRTSSTRTPSTRTPPTRTPPTRTPPTRTPSTLTPQSRTPRTRIPPTGTPRTCTLQTRTPPTRTTQTRTSNRTPPTCTPRTRTPRTCTPRNRWIYRLVLDDINDG